jgi:hypothetical protein
MVTFAPSWIAIEEMVKAKGLDSAKYKRCELQSRFEWAGLSAERDPPSFSFASLLLSPMLSKPALRALRAARLPHSSKLPAAAFSSSSVSNNGVSEFGQRHVAAGLSGRLSQAVIQSGKGSYITLNDQRGEYLDFTSGIGVTALGASLLCLRTVK